MIAEDRIEEVIEKLLEKLDLTNDKLLFNNTIILKLELTRNKKAMNIGLSNNKESVISRTDIAKAILDIIDQAIKNDTNNAALS